MYRIALLNLPVASLTVPTLALTQIRGVLRTTFGDRVSADLHYLNHDFAHYMSVGAYQQFSSFDHHPFGLGEWFFRQAAFPDAPDNTEEYFQRYYPQHLERNRVIKQFLVEKRTGVVAHFEAMIDRYRLAEADLVGLTSMFSQNVACIAMARLLKARNPGMVMVLGGANCEGVMGRQVADAIPWLDFVFSGPSLESFPRLVDCLMAGDAEGPHQIDGVFSRRNHVVDGACGTGSDGSGATFGVRLFGSERSINDPIELDYSDFLDAYETRFPEMEPPMLFFETSRGCWWGERAHCTFCGLNGSTMAYRTMDPALAFRTLDSLFQYAGRCQHLQSVDNILPKTYFDDFLPYLDTPEDMDLFYEVKADLTEDDFRILAKARVLRIQPGIEALNTSTLKLMRKGTSSFQNVQFLINSLRYGIYPVWNLLVGFPREGIEVYEKYLEDLPLLTHLPPPSGVFPVRFDRFSPYFAEADDYGLQLRPLDWYPLTYPLGEEVLQNLAYYFADHNYGASYAMNAARMLGKLREKAGTWATAWRNSGTRPELVLHHRPGQTWVHDTRSGEAVEYPIDEPVQLLLEALRTPKKVPALEKELGADHLDGALSFVRARRLVFEEGERILSLVVPPPTGHGIALEGVKLEAAVA